MIWNHAIPWDIFPGQYVKFYHEKDNNIVEQSGRIENLGYVLVRQQQVFTTHSIFNISCNMQLRLNLI